MQALVRLKSSSARLFVMQQLRPSTHAWLGASLPPELGPRALPFATAVVAQVAHPLGAPAAAHPSRRERAVGRRLVRLLAASVGDAPAVERAADALAGDPPLLAAAFQNVDLLYAHACPAADRVSLLVMGAIERLGRPAARRRQSSGAPRSR